MAKDRKTLVIGSTGHMHAICVEWRDVLSVNLVDFDLVVVNCRPLTSEFLTTHRGDFFRKIRTRLTRLLASEGQIVILGTAIQSGEDSNVRPPDTYAFCPLSIGTAMESGDTIEIRKHEFSGYLEKFEKWDYWYYLPMECLTTELTYHFGSVIDKSYIIPQDLIAANRYGKALAVRFPISVQTKKGGLIVQAGSIVVLPDIPEIESRTAINLVLEDLLGLPQVELPPEWAATLSVPGVAELRAQIDARGTAIRKLEIEVETLEGRIAEREWYKKLLYASGPELESVFAKSLEQMGATITPAQYSQEEFVLAFEGSRCLVECKGVSKSAARAHIGQLTVYMDAYEENEGAAGKGVLFVNAWRNLPFVDRETATTPTFPPNVIERAENLGIALVSATSFFSAFCKFLEGRLDGLTILRKVITTDGVVIFDQDD
jgi:hypothetical protein